jgi:RNA polymerase sigma-70 factor, ECF subfamily
MDDGQALRALQKGDAAALETLMERYTPYVTATAAAVLGPGASAQDVEETAADAFVALWRNAGRIRPEKLRPWLAAVTRNGARNRLRAQRTALPLEDDVVLLECTPMEFEAERRALEAAVREAVLALGQPDRDIFLLHYYYYEPVAGIAARLGMNGSTVKSRLRRGREKLRRVLEQGGFADEIQGERPDGAAAGGLCRG